MPINKATYMASYKQWNRMIVNYFTSGLPSGSTIYLSVDQDVLVDIGQQFDQSRVNNEDLVNDFLLAIRSQCVNRQEIILDKIKGKEADGLPLCIAFLGALILAAYWMAEDENGADNNYFTRLRQVLDLPIDDSGRPVGLRPTGVEEHLWKQWNRWLVQNGFLTTAKRGKSNILKYINYPLSQTLLREVDKERIVRIFKEEANLHSLNKACDQEQLTTWIRINNHLFTAKHLRTLFQDKIDSRREALYDRMFEVYSSIDWAAGVDSVEDAKKTYNSRRITAGIFRNEDSIAGTIDYLLYPRMPQRGQAASLILIKEGKPYPLVEERTGWFSPLWTESLKGGVAYRVESNNQIKELKVPKRKFWILVSDPEDNNSGVMASWGKPRPFEPFILLCHQEYFKDLDFLQNLGLIEWGDRLTLKKPNSNWTEFQQCIIKSFDWKAVPANRSELFEELRPNTSALILLRGGLRLPGGKGWLEYYPPEIAIQAPEPKLRILVSNLADIKNPLFDEKVEANNYFTFPGHLQGDYLVQVYKEKSSIVSRKLVRIIPWESLTCHPPKTSYEVRVGELVLQGARIKIESSS